jgi:hypothetical protein
MKRFIVFGISILAVALTPACDSSSGDGTGDGTGMTLDTGLDETAALSDLTDAQQVSACEAAEAYWGSMAPSEDAQKHMSCIMMSAMMAGGMFDMMDEEDAGEAGDPLAICQASYDECMASDMEGEEPGMGMERQASDCTPDDLSACTTVTVGDLEACADASMAEGMEEMAAIAAMTCATAMSDMDAGMAETPPSAACTLIEEGCPALGNDDMDMGGDDDDSPPAPGDRDDMDDDDDGGTDDGEGSDDEADPEPVPAG